MPDELENLDSYFNIAMEQLHSLKAVQHCNTKVLSVLCNSLFISSVCWCKVAKCQQGEMSQCTRYFAKMYSMSTLLGTLYTIHANF